MIETLQERAIRILAQNGYSATMDAGFSGGFITVKDPVRVLTGGNDRTEYKSVRLHHMDVFKFLDARS